MVSASVSGKAMGSRPLGATSPNKTEAQAEPRGLSAQEERLEKSSGIRSKRRVLSGFCKGKSRGRDGELCFSHGFGLESSYFIIFSTV